MSKGTLWFAIVAGLLVLIELAGGTVQDFFFREQKLNQKALTKATKQLRLKERSLRRMEVAIEKFKDRSKMSLNGDAAKASIEYQEYLVRLTDACSLSSVMVGSSQPERVEELGHVLHFSIQATGTTEQFGKLIDGFNQTEALHRLSHVNIFQSLGPDSPTHSITMDIALLVLDAAEENSDINRSITPPSSDQMTDLFSSIDIFRRPGSGIQDGSPLTSMFGNMLQNLPPTVPENQEPTIPAESPTPPPEPVVEKPDPKSNVRLVGVMQKGEKKYAMFFNSLDNQQYALEEQSPFEGMGIDARITRIAQTDVWLIFDDNELRLSIGDLFNQAIKD